MKKIIRSISILVVFMFFITNLYAQMPEEEMISVQAQKGQQKSNTISLDIKGMDILDVLKLISMRSGMNIVAGKNVTGRVTIFLKDVDVWDAFEIILAANDLAYEKRANIINVMTQRDYELLYGQKYGDKRKTEIIQLKYAKASDVAKSLNQIKTNIGRIVADESTDTLVLFDTPESLKEMENFISNIDKPTETRIFSLNYAKAEDVKAKVQEILTKGVGAIQIDERTNKIAVKDLGYKLDNIEKIINAFDEKHREVLIDSKIVEITLTDNYNMGVNWAIVFKKFDIRQTLTGGLTSGGKLTIGSIWLGSSSSDVVIDVLKEFGDVRTLSNPRITAINNQEAKILVGTKKPYVTQTTSQGGTGTQVTADQVTFVDIGVKLYVTPTINKDGFITIKIRPEVSSSTASYTYGSPEKSIPIVDTSEAETSIMVKDGTTIIMGGLIKEEKTKNIKKIPIAGDMPLLGGLFRKTKDELTKKELAIFITPHIVSGESSLTEVPSGLSYKKATAVPLESTAMTKYMDLPEYYQLIWDRINNIVKSKQIKTKGEVTVSFTISSTGYLQGEPTVLNQTDETLGKLTIQSVKEAEPFPAFPDKLDKNQERFKIAISYE